MSDTEADQQQPTNAAGLLHIKPVHGGYIIEGRFDGKGGFPTVQSVVAGEHGSKNLKRQITRDLRALVGYWVEQFFTD